MGIVNKTETMGGSGWLVDADGEGIHLILSEDEIRASDILEQGFAGSSLAVHMAAPNDPVPAQLAARARAIILEVQPGNEESMRRLSALRAAAPNLPIVAAVRDAAIPVVRALLRSGINDVISLPLTGSELQALLGDVRRYIAECVQGETRASGLVSVIKSAGGVGATMVATQAASLHARMNQGLDRKVALLDLDLQFGNVGLYLGVHSSLTMMDLIQAGNRVDAEFLSTVTVETPTGLRVVTAPDEIMPIEAANADQILRIVEHAQASMGAVYLDLPGNWTNWSLSLVLRSDVVLIIVDLTIASLRQARRQIELLRSQGIDPSRIRVVANRIERRLFRSIGFKDAEAAINHPITMSIASEPGLVTSALNQGILVEQLASNSRVARELRGIVDNCVVPALQVTT